MAIVCQCQWSAASFAVRLGYIVSDMGNYAQTGRGSPDLARMRTGLNAKCATGALRPEEWRAGKFPFSYGRGGNYFAIKSPQVSARVSERVAVGRVGNQLSKLKKIVERTT
jgi:hypothetical protein